MAPEKEADGLVIDKIKVSATQSLNHYNFQVTLVQQILKKRYANGYITLNVIGSLDDVPTKLALKDISTFTKKNLTFSFQYFQVFDGSFTLPERFVPEKVQISAILTKSKWQKYQKVNKTISWILD